VTLRWTEEELDAAIRAADPAVTPAGAEPSAAARARLQTIMAEAAPVLSPAAPPRRRRARVAGWSIGGVVAGLAAAITIAVVVSTAVPAPAVAVTPPPLEPTPIATTLPQLMEESIRTLDAQPAGTLARNGQVVTWQMPDGKDGGPIVPERYAWVPDGDGTGHLKVVTDPAYSVVDGKVAAPTGDVPTPGTTVAPQRWANGRGLFPEAPPSDGPDALAAYLRAHVPLPASPDAMNYFGALSILLGEWTLTPQQHADALRLLEQTGDLRVLGRVTDRLGRDGVAFSIHSAKRSQFTVTVVLDAATRRIIAADTVYAGGVDTIGAAPGSVVEYSAWVAP